MLETVDREILNTGSNPVLTANIKNMKVKYTPGENGLVGKTYNVEIINMDLLKVEHVNKILLNTVTIKYEDGRTETINGGKLFNSIDMFQKSVSLKVY